MTVPWVEGHDWARRALSQARTPPCKADEQEDEVPCEGQEA